MANTNFEATCPVRIYVKVAPETTIEEAKEVLRNTLLSANIDFLDCSLEKTEIREN